MTDNQHNPNNTQRYAASHRQTMLRESGVPPVLVAIDLVDDPNRALGVAWSRAAQMGASLVVCHVSPEGEGRDRGPSVRQAVDHWMAMVCPNNKHVELDLRRGNVATEILASAEAHSACLIVVGEVAHREGWFARLFRPNVTTELVRSASRPVLIARHNFGTGQILVATDMSVPNLPTLQAAVSELDRNGGTVTVLHCIPPVATLAGDPTGSLMSPNSYDAIVNTATVRLIESARSVGLADADCRVVIEDPATAIVALAQQLTADIIIVGTHGRTGADRALMGSVAEAVIRSAPCHVLVVRLHEDASDRTDVSTAVPIAHSYEEIEREEVPLPTLIYRSTDSQINAAVEPPPDHTSWDGAKLSRSKPKRPSVRR